MRYVGDGTRMSWLGVLLAFSAVTSAQATSLGEEIATLAREVQEQDLGRTSAPPSPPQDLTDQLPALRIGEPPLRGGLAATPEGSMCTTSTIPSTFIEWDVLGNGPDWDPMDPTPRCQNAFYCFTPELGAPQYSVLPAGCDPTMQSCTLEVRVHAHIPHVHQETQLGTRVLAEWYGTANPGGTPISTCGTLGGNINNSLGEAFLRIQSLQCNNLTGDRFRSYSLRVSACPFSPSCVKRASITGINLTATRVAAELGCPEPPPRDCNDRSDCETCLLAGGPGGPGAGVGGEGASFGGDGELGMGPNATLRYLAGGVGGDDFPGTPAWRTELGL
ncbi:MAG: hypothetical protein KDD47_27630, partial [Acidobacteria bacterium]|nr:hypothetical protein [Acidobacteriota bacterium]